MQKKVGHLINCLEILLYLGQDAEKMWVTLLTV